MVDPLYMQFLRIYGSAPGNSTSHWLYGYIVCMFGKKIACARRRQWHPLQYFAWKIPWTEEPGKLQSMGSLRVGHDWVTSLSLFTFLHWEGNGNPLQCSCLENPRDRGAWWAAVSGVAQSRTRLKGLSSSSSMCKWACAVQNHII